MTLIGYSADVSGQAAIEHTKLPPPSPLPDQVGTSRIQDPSVITVRDLRGTTEAA